MLLGEVHRWGLYPDRVRALLPAADRAIAWMQTYGDRDGDGYIEYERSSPDGLLNQGWKDSPDSVTFVDGTIPRPPIALCEVQGYAYAAYLARADLADAYGEAEVARDCRDRAGALRSAFNRDFWLPGPGHYAVALDGDKRPVDSLASNMAHCLWTGIADPEHAAAVADHLASPAMFTGWGVRTLATTMGAFNPLSYHNGSVWPHDNAIAVAGLARYGFNAKAQRLALATLAAAGRFDGRLPELFAGLDRGEVSVPVSYPSSCSPQAWASAAPLLMLRSLLHFDPDVPHGRLHLAPALPPGTGRITVSGIRIGAVRVNIAVADGQAMVTGLPDGVQVTPARMVR
jgi:glycogen debranching enzyme